MFILREVRKDGSTINMAFDYSYEVVSRMLNRKGLFPSTCEQFGWNIKETPDDCFAFLVSQNKVHPLYLDNEYYVMTENGKTFEHIVCAPILRDYLMSEGKCDEQG